MKLRAEDSEDLAVIAACLQDAIIPIGEMCYLPRERRFVLVANRFKWENADAPRVYGDGPHADVEDAPFERTNCGLAIDGVDGVRRRNLDPRRRGEVLSLLTILAQGDGLMLVFSGDACIHLRAQQWSCRLQDIGDPWPCRVRPRHAANDGKGVVAASE